VKEFQFAIPSFLLLHLILYYLIIYLFSYSLKITKTRCLATKRNERKKSQKLSSWIVLLPLSFNKGVCHQFSLCRSSIFTHSCFSFFLSPLLFLLLVDLGKGIIEPLVSYRFPRGADDKFIASVVQFCFPDILDFPKETMERCVRCSVLR
jgi:hypothetical protein